MSNDGFLILVYVIRFFLKRHVKNYPLLVKRLKNGGKIIFSAWQIAASLPTVAPTIPLPEIYIQAVGMAQVLNLNPMQFISIDCVTGGIIKYRMQTLSTTLVIIAACAILILRGKGRAEEIREKYFNATLALTYLTLPTITTMIFSMIPCDSLDTGMKYLRADYEIDCNDDSAFFWGFYTVLMILTFPIGVTSIYSYLLWKNRARINKPVEEREKDQRLMAIGFLFDPYKPEFWFFEIIETVRRLAMTGVLSTIEPGSYTQLATGLIFTFTHTVIIRCECAKSEAQTLSVDS